MVASIARRHRLAAKHSVHPEDVVPWTFEFEDQGYFAGYRTWPGLGELRAGEGQTRLRKHLVRKEGSMSAGLSGLNIRIAIHP